jgi:uncharacterized protein
MKRLLPHTLPVFAAALSAVLLSGCGKPETAKVVSSDDTVKAGGDLPASGMGSRLKNEQSAFLRRHANDPMEWYPWGSEAFERSKKENKPLLVVVGYASCPWSEKMTVESYTNAEAARFANRNFICVLVDREERPDINTALLHYVFWKSRGTKSGWPLHVWLTPDGLPMESAVYVAPVSSGSVPGWSSLLEIFAGKWTKDSEYETETARKDVDAFFRTHRLRWQGPPADGNLSVPLVREFIAKSPAERLKTFRAFNDDFLAGAINDLPTSVLEELWKQMSPEEIAGVIARLRAVGAAALYAKISGPSRAAALDRFLSEVRKDCYAKLRSTYDPVNSGFGPAPRFTQHQALEFLLRFAVRHKGDQFGNDRDAMKMARLTFDAMLKGGIYDQLGGGFHRYSTDAYWAVPQFEKMIYDQGYMASVLISASQVTGNQEWARAAVETLKYAASELSHPEGGFYCAEGSTSAGKDGAKAEGAYYVWSKAEFDAAAGDKSALLHEVFNIEERGNLPMDSQMRTRLGNTNVLSIRRSPEEAGAASSLSPADARAAFEEGRARLLEARRKRPRPQLEDKVLTSWSSTAVIGFARAGFTLSDDKLVQRGEKAAEFLLAKLRTKDGALLHAFLDGPSPLPGYSEDYATFIGGLIHLYEATGSPRWLTAAIELQERQIKDLWDKDDGGFFDGPETKHLFFRMKSMDEASEIAAGSTSLINLATLSVMLNSSDYRDKARRIVERFGAHAALTPSAFYRFLQAADIVGDAPRQIVISGAPDAPGRAALLAEIRKSFRPALPLLYMDGGESEKLLLSKVPDLSALAAQPGKATVHLCGAFKAEKSFTDPKELAAALSAACGWTEAP